MKKIKKNDKILKESSNPINKESIINIENNHNTTFKGDNSNDDSGKGFKEKTKISLYINKNPKEKEEKITIFNSNSEMVLTTKNLQNRINISKGDISFNKKERYKLEQIMRNDLRKNYKEKDIKNKKLKKNNLYKNNNDDINNQKKNKNKNKNRNKIEMNNQININKNIILKNLIKIQLILLFLVSLNIILYIILNKNNKLNNLDLYISTLSLSCILFAFTLFLIILIILGIFQHYDSTNIFRLLCIINFCISISLMIIQIISILHFKSDINIENEKIIKKIFVYFLIFSITGIIILVNIFIGAIAKESLLILIGYKNENVCPERKIKKGGNRHGGNYVYFNEEIDGYDVNLNTLKKFHACIL